MLKQNNQKALIITILLIALIQMPQYAIMPATNHIATKIFPELSIQTIQTAMSLPAIIAVFSGVAAAMLVRFGLASKKATTIIGLSLIALTGLMSAVLHSKFWHLCLLNSLIGAGMGAFIPNIQSIMFDNFDEKTRQFITGIQFSFINVGGIILTLLCGFLTATIWYGGHLIMLVAIPVIIVSFLIIPKDARIKPTDEDSSTKSKLPSRVYYYAALIIIYMILFNVSTVNISTHLENGNMGDASTAGIASALLMAGGVFSGLIFPKLSQSLHDNTITLSFLMMTIGFTLMNLFPTSLPITFVSMFISGTTMGIFVPRCLLCVSNLTNPSNSSMATMLACSVAPGVGSFVSPVIITNLTLALGHESTRFRFQFTAVFCLIAAVVLFVYNRKFSK